MPKTSTVTLKNTSNDFCTFFKAAKNYISPKLTPENILLASQVYNGFVAAAVTLSYLTTPNASLTEYGFDVSVHVLQAFITKNAPDLLIAAAYATNGIRAFNIFNHALANDSTIPNFLNTLDLFNHLEGVAATTFAKAINAYPMG